ncbi:MAG: transporter substrate-binding domain-containing protein [Deltaproteobacteria bacterium]|jgi:polar amino acid transport system substrate-binding protein|nr:transporter substrate-binding domain-containing protein [Deltaproteobacteria bacterium]
MKNFILLILTILFSISTYAENKTISICSFEWPPHHGTTLKDEGYTADLIKAIFEPQGYMIKKRFLPWKRAQVWAAEGKECDAITEIYLNRKRLEIFWYGSPYVVHEVFLIALKSYPVKNYNNLRELKGLVFGHNSGGSLSDEFDSADYITKFETKGYKIGIRMLLAKRFDFYVSARSVALYEAKKMGQLDKIHTVGKPLQRQFVYMAFSKANSKNTERLRDYNQGLFLVQRSGEYSNIMKKHGFK